MVNWDTCTFFCLGYLGALGRTNLHATQPPRWTKVLCYLDRPLCPIPVATNRAVQRGAALRLRVPKTVPLSRAVTALPKVIRGHWTDGAMDIISDLWQPHTRRFTASTIFMGVAQKGRRISCPDPSGLPHKLYMFAMETKQCNAVGTAPSFQYVLGAARMEWTGLGLKVLAPAA